MPDNEEQIAQRVNEVIQEAKQGCRDRGEIELVNERKPKCYVAGPMTGYPELNYPAFHAAAARLRGMGFEVISPAELNPVTEAYLPAMKNDIKALIDCDHIHMLQGWQASKGAALEHHIATVLGIQPIEFC